MVMGMFNIYNATHSVKINAVTGAILRNHPKSWFRRFHLKSGLADSLLTPGGHRTESWRENDNDIIVLQMVICGDMEVIAECVYRKDYNDFCSYGERREGE